MQGVYTLANDAVIDWLIALLESLRSDPANATLPVTVIPYDHRVERTRALQADYRFEVLQDDALTVLDRLGAKVSRPDRALLPDLRKFAAFWGPYEQFVYLDADIVVVEDIRRLLETARAPGADLIYFDHDIRQVYREDRVADLPFRCAYGPWFQRRSICQPSRRVRPRSGGGHGRSCAAIPRMFHRVRRPAFPELRLRRQQSHGGAVHRVLPRGCERDVGRTAARAARSALDCRQCRPQ